MVVWDRVSMMSSTTVKALRPISLEYVLKTGRKREGYQCQILHSIRMISLMTLQ